MIHNELFVLPGNLFHLHWSCIQSLRPKAEGWTQSQCWGPPKHSPKTQRICLSLLWNIPKYFTVLTHFEGNITLSTGWRTILLYHRWTHIALGGGDGTGCPCLPPEVGSAVLVHQELWAHWLHSATHTQNHENVHHQTHIPEIKTYLRSSWAHKVDACCVRERLTIGHADRAVRVFEQQVVPTLDDRPSLSNAHVADWYNLLQRTLRAVGLDKVKNRI